MSKSTMKRAGEELVLVTGATGKTGRRVAAGLEARGVATRRVSRSSTPAFDWREPTSWPAALEGVTAAYLVFHPDLAVPGAADAIEAFSKLAVASGVERLVLLSGRGEEEAERCEGIVAASGAQWTVVRASWFNQNFSEAFFLEPLQVAGILALPASAQVLEPFVDVDDIAEVAVAALSEDGHHGHVYEVTGPRLLTLAEAIAEIGAASGRSMRYEEISDASYRAQMDAAGVPKEMTELTSYLFSTILDGRNSRLADGVERALGRPPRDFRDYARQAAAKGVWRVAGGDVAEQGAAPRQQVGS